MSSSLFTDALCEDLIACGDPRENYGWVDRSFDYVARLNLNRSHVPALLAIARQMVEPREWSDDEDDLSWTAPIHAYRALAQLGAPEAVDALLGMMDRLDELDDGWYLEEFAPALGLIGPPAFDATAAYLADRGHRMYPVSAAAHAMEEIANRHPEFRGRAVECIAGRLADLEAVDTELNGFLVGFLLNLKAVEAAEVIERAYAADRVDDSIVGPWHKVRTELGVEGLGLMSEAKARRGYEPAVGQHGGGGLIEPSDRLNRGFKSRDKQKRKAQKQAKRRGRRRR